MEEARANARVGLGFEDTMTTWALISQHRAKVYSRAMEFKQMGLPEIKSLTSSCQKHHHWELHGRIIFGTLLDDIFVGEDELIFKLHIDRSAQQDWIELHVLNFSLADAQIMFPINSKVSVVEPSLYFTPEGLLLEIVNPLKMFVLGLELDLPDKDPSFFHSRGNAAYSSGQLVLAIQYYSLAISNMADLVPLYSNRAEAWIKLGNYKKAVRDADRALALDPAHCKSLLRKVRALCGLQQHRLAYDTIIAWINMYPSENNVHVRALIQRCSLLVEQSERGIYHLTDFLLSGKAKAKVPECSDYVNSCVRIGVTKDGKGRGVFTSKSLEIGELISVSNALAVVQNQGNNISNFEFKSKIMLSCMCSSRMLEQLNAVINKHEVPDMKVYKPNSIHMEQEEEESSGMMRVVKLDMHLVEQMVSHYSFSSSMCGTAVLGDYFGLWPLTSFYNHSCLPNVSFTVVGPAVFIRASRNISSNEELTLSYIDPLMPLYWREQYLNWGFTCSCARCKLEKSLEKELSRINDQAKSCFPDPNNCGPQLNMFFLGIVASQIEELLRSNELNLQAKNWIRASYGRCYMAHIIPAENIVDAFHSTCPGHPATLVLMLQVSQEMGKPMLELKGKGSALFMQECLASFGKHTSQVYSSIMEHHINHKFGQEAYKFQIAICI